MNSVLITGGSGFIGTSLVEYHRALGDKVFNLDIAEPRNGDHRENWIHADIRRQDELMAILNRIRPCFVYHLAARTDFDGKSLADYSSNTVGVESLIESLGEASHRVRRVIYASTRFVCPVGYTPKDEFDYCPDTYYGESKVLGEKLVRDRGTAVSEWIIVRPTSIWGPWFGTPFREFFRAINRGLYVHPAKIQIFKSLGYIGNTVQSLHCLMTAPAPSVCSRTFYVADYEATEIGCFADLIQEAFGVRRVPRVPMALLRLLAVAGDASMHLGVRHPPLTTYRLGNMTANAVYDIAPLQAIVGAQPFSPREGIRETVRWMRERAQ